MRRGKIYVSDIYVALIVGPGRISYGKGQPYHQSLHVGMVFSDGKKMISYICMVSMHNSRYCIGPAGIGGGKGGYYQTSLYNGMVFSDGMLH